MLPQFQTIVQLNNEECLFPYMQTMSKNKLKTSPSSPSTSQSQVQYDIEVKDKNLLLFTRIESQKNRTKSHSSKVMKFDYVGYASSPNIIGKFTELVNEVLETRYPCCIIRYNTTRGVNQSEFLCELLVNELNKVVKKSTMCIFSITLEYYDVQSSKIENIFAKSSRNKEVLKVFPSTKELQHWLLNDYSQVWSSGEGHESFEFQINICDSNSRNHTVKLAILQFYTNIMSENSKIHMHNFLKNLNAKKMTCHSYATNCIWKYMQPTSRPVYSVWMLFDVPSLYGGSSHTEDLLRFATAAYTSLTAISEKLKQPKEYDMALAVQSAPKTEKPSQSFIMQNADLFKI